MCDMDAIMDIATKHDLKVVEDVAHQHGSRWRNRGAGAIGDAGSFSFQQSKVLTCGEGGAVTCNDDEVFEIVHCLKQVGWAPDMTPGNRYGHNYRMTEMQAVLLRGGLRRLEEQTRIREERAATIRGRLDQIGGPLRAARRDPRITRQAYYGMTLVYDPGEAGGLERTGYLRALGAEGCGMGAPYAPVYSNKLLNLYDATSPVPYRQPESVQDYRALRLPNVERATGETAVILSHIQLLGDSDYIGDLMTAVQKVNDALPFVREWWKKERKED
jgi:dTDP-4-amino-4,6-dideoxygalactose transaminase